LLPNRVYFSEVQPKEDEMIGARSTYGELINAYRILVGNPEGKQPLGKSARRWILNWILRKWGWPAIINLWFCLRRLVADPSPRRPGFAPGSVQVGFVVDNAALGQVFLRVLRFSPVNIIPPWLYIFIYHLGDKQ
jgi:hypothetical protein